jgi:phosphate-selective porin OprO/OprP
MRTTYVFTSASVVFLLAAHAAAQPATDPPPTAAPGAAGEPGAPPATEAASAGEAAGDESAASAVDDSPSVEAGASPASPPVAVAPEATQPAEPAAAGADANVAATPTTEAPPIAGYDGGFYIRSADKPFELKIGARIQARYTYEALEDAPDEAQFSIPRARLALKGKAFSDDLLYKLQIDFGKGSVALKDFYVDYAIVPKVLHVRVGQYKRPFSRQQITSSGKQELVDRAITDKAFRAGRDIGVMFHNNYEKSPPFEYAVGIFNGTGDKAAFQGDVLVDPATGEGEVTSGSFSNVPAQNHPMVVGRVGYNYGDLKGYSEADLEGGDLRFGIALGGLADFDADQDDATALRGNVDFVVKVQGFSATGGVYVSSRQSGTDFGDRAYDAAGYHLQGGFVIAERFQPVVRYAFVEPSGNANAHEEILGGFAVYAHGHHLKWQTDAGVVGVESATGPIVDGIVRSQLQLSF